MTKRKTVARRAPAPDGRCYVARLVGMSDTPHSDEQAAFMRTHWNMYQTGLTIAEALRALRNALPPRERWPLATLPVFVEDASTRCKFGARYHNITWPDSEAPPRFVMRLTLNREGVAS